jgi:hypothetical protein
MGFGFLEFLSEISVKIQFFDTVMQQVLVNRVPNAQGNHEMKNRVVRKHPIRCSCCERERLTRRTCGRRKDHPCLRCCDPQNEGKETPFPFSQYSIAHIIFPAFVIPLVNSLAQVALDSLWNAFGKAGRIPSNRRTTFNVIDPYFFQVLFWDKGVRICKRGERKVIIKDSSVLSPVFGENWEKKFEYNPSTPRLKEIVFEKGGMVQNKFKPSHFLELKLIEKEQTFVDPKFIMEKSKETGFIIPQIVANAPTRTTKRWIVICYFWVRQSA